MMNQTTQKSTLGHAAKRERQRILSNILKNSTEAFFKQLRITKGMKGLHVDCGDGKVTLQLAALLGREATVLGVDSNPYNIEIATQKMERDNAKNTTFLSKEAFEKMSPQKYDFVYCRFLLSSSSNPMKDILKMYHLLKPGGLILFEDIDLTNHFSSPYSFAFERYTELYLAVIRKRGADPSFGLKLYKTLENVGFQNVKPQLIPPSFLIGEGKKLASLTLESISDAILKEKLAIPAELQALLAELKDFEQQALSMISLPGVYQVSGIKPIIKNNNLLFGTTKTEG